jgi:GxxExxY protein
VYHRALCHALAMAKVPFQSQREYDVLYKGHVCGTFKPDIVVKEKIILELKATDSLCTQHEAQTLSYLKATGLRLAMLINFGETSLVVKRFAK